MTFRIELRIRVPSLQGLDALDWRRVHGLPDSLAVAPSFLSFVEDVDEAFARLHFESDSLYERVDVSAELLVPGELKPADDRFPNSQNLILGNLTPERGRALWVEGRHQAELEDLRRQIARQAAELSRNTTTKDEDE
jgi:hypothetical protein